MTELIDKQEKHTASIKLTFTKQDKKDQIIKHSVLIGGRRHRADNIVEISLDTFKSTCCHWGHITLQSPNTDRLKCQLYTGPHTTKKNKCKIAGCPVRWGRGCRHTLTKCADCRVIYYAT